MVFKTAIHTIARIVLRIVFTSFLFTTTVYGQELAETTSSQAEATQAIGYMGIHIGMSRDEALAAAESNDLMTVPKNRDVDFFPVEEREIITLSIKPEVPFMYLQFFDNVLYAITVIFNERYMDYFTLSNAVTERYGEYTSLTPQWRQWRLDRVTIKVEKPAVVKYIALSDFLEAASFEARIFQFDIQRREQLLDGL